METSPKNTNCESNNPIQCENIGNTPRGGVQIDSAMSVHLTNSDWEKAWEQLVGTEVPGLKDLYRPAETAAVLLSSGCTLEQWRKLALEVSSLRLERERVIALRMQLRQALMLERDNQEQELTQQMDCDAEWLRLDPVQDKIHWAENCMDTLAWE